MFTVLSWPATFVQVLKFWFTVNLSLTILGLISFVLNGLSSFQLILILLLVVVVLTLVITVLVEVVCFKIHQGFCIYKITWKHALGAVEIPPPAGQNDELYAKK